MLKPPKSNSFFLFGARATGKTTWLEFHFPPEDPTVLWIDLLRADDEEMYTRQPDRLFQQIEQRKRGGKLNWVVIDEVQKIPKLLDVVHRSIQKQQQAFALSGSSARKLKRGQANLLAGRAFSFRMHPLVHIELGHGFDLDESLSWGSLPVVLEESSELDRKRGLKSYVQTYLKEEILSEQLVRKIDPFRQFLPVAAQSSGSILNFSRIAREANIETKSVQRYFEILEDTLIGHYLPAYHSSLRKQQRLSPKFYFFDLGVLRALEGDLNPVSPQSYAYGRFFEHFVVLECIRLRDYLERDIKFSYLKLKNGFEVDLILEEKSKPTLLVEIKSGTRVGHESVKKLQAISKDFPTPCKLQIWCQEKQPRLQEEVEILPWQLAMKGALDL